MNAYDLIKKERNHQVFHLGYDAKHDDQHTKGELALAAACYLTPKERRSCNQNGVPLRWPFEPSSWRATPQNRIKEVLKGLALGLAELERLQRLEVANAEKLLGEIYLEPNIKNAPKRPLYDVTGFNKLKIGDKIRKGDFWEDSEGNLHTREHVKWFERLSRFHCPHYRIGVLSIEKGENL